MEDRVIKLGTDRFHISEIVRAEIIDTDLDEIRYDVSKLKQKIEEVINKYRRNIASCLPRPHIDFVNSERCNFVLRGTFSGTDIDVEWKYYYDARNPGWTCLGYDTTVLSFQNDIIPAINQLISISSKDKKKKRKDALKTIADIALSLLGSEVSIGSNLDELSPENKKELADIIGIYEDGIKKRHLNTLLVFLEKSPYPKCYIQNQCGFDIFEKHREIIDTLHSITHLNKNEDVNIIDQLLHAKKPLFYKNRELVKDGDTIWFGDKSDKYIIAIEVISYVGGIPNIYIMSLTDSKTQMSNIRIKCFDKCYDLQQALDIGTCWLDNEVRCSNESKEYASVEGNNRNVNQQPDSDSNWDVSNSGLNRGERDVEYNIQWLPDSVKKHIITIGKDCTKITRKQRNSNCILLKNSAFKDEAQEYDHILVTPAGVIIIETKGWKGDILIQEGGKCLRKKDEHSSYESGINLKFQLRRHERLLQSILPDIPLYSILCFSHPAANISGCEHMEEYIVINIDQLEDKIVEICAKNSYSDEKIAEIAGTIESFKINKNV